MASGAGAVEPAGPGTGRGTTTTLDGVDIDYLEPLELAAGAGDADSTVTLLTSGTTVPIGDDAAEERPLQRTVLHWASFGGNPTVILAVLEAVASSGVAASNASGGSEGGAGAAATATALEATCFDVAGRGGMTALHLVAEHGHVAAAVVLLEAGAVDTLSDYSYDRPLALAVRAGHGDMVAELLRRGSLGINDSLDGLNYTALHIAAEEGHFGLVGTFLQEGAEVDARTDEYHTPLHFAVGCGPDAEATTAALLAAGADVNAGGADNESALCKASDAEVLRALLAAGADLYWNECIRASPVDRAVTADKVEKLSVFLEAGMDPNRRGPFNSAQRPPPGSSLWAHGAFHLSRQRHGGASLLHRAARWLSAGAVELLLAAGAREDVPALTYARRVGDTPEKTTLPIDVIGADVVEMTPETRRRADAIRSMIAGAYLYRKGWLSVLRDRFDAGESFTGSGGGGGGGSGGAQTDGVEGPSPQRENGAARGRGSRDVGVVAVEEEAWYGAVVWIASVPGPDVFRIITEFL